MKRKPVTRQTEQTPHLDPLPFGRGEETPATPARASAAADGPTRTLLSPIGGEDQGEGTTALTNGLSTFKPLRPKPSMRFGRNFRNTSQGASGTHPHGGYWEVHWIDYTAVWSAG